MKRAVSIDEVRGMLRCRADLALLGWNDRRIRAAVTDREIVRVHRGWYVESQEWERLWPEGRHLAAVVAASYEMVGGTHVVSHVSAGVIWGIPLYRFTADRVHVTGSTTMQASGTAAVIRHEDRLRPSDVTVVDGIRCTTLERTAFDLMRLLPLEAAVAVADAALGMASVVRHVQDDDLAAAWRERMRARAADAGAVRGIRQTRWLIDYARGAAQLPGESVSRLQLTRLGFGRMEVQVPVSGSAGAMYWLDLGLEEVNSFGEFDGDTKYLDEAMRAGLTVEQVLLREKQREDWVRGTTQRRLGRWGTPHIDTPLALGRRLASFGIHPPR